MLVNIDTNDSNAMPDPLDSISRITAIPFSSSSQHKISLKGRPQNDSDIDKFANLFNPQTPPASPTLPPIFSQSKPTSSIRSGNLPYRQTHVKQESVGSGDSEFGSFVSVPPNQDPLSELLFPALPSAFTPTPSFEARTDFVTAGSTVSLPSNSTRAFISKPACSHKDTQSPSRIFFSKFTEDAKARGEKGKEYLNELLQHEDDPLYWVQSEVEGDQGAQEIGCRAEPVIDNQHKDQEMSGIGRLDNVADKLEDSPLNLDGDSASYPSSSGKGHGFHQRPISGDQPYRAKQFSTPSLSAPFPVSRSPPQLHPPPRPVSTAPSTNISSIPSPSAPQIVRSSSSSSVPLSTSLSSSPPSSSYHNSLTASSRWMSSLISTSRPSAPSTSANAPPSLHSIFASRSTSSDDLLHPQIGPYHPKVQGSLPTLPHTTAMSVLKPHHSQTIPPPSSSFNTGTASSFIPSSSASRISHGTPFASRPYVPPSGAPGFAGDHAWDKGFSNDFDKERVEKKSISLHGRKGMTSPVLDESLAGLIRPYLPALARLPRKWSLLYSLDQHGISLNTLYTCCEPQGPMSSHPKGALVVMKDSGDAVFGAWMGEGLKLSRGSYYGSGESFLWKYVDRTLKVFKWTGKNDYVALCESEYLSFGGGDGHYGLYLDDTLLDGSSARCPTFDNEPLCSVGAHKSDTASFECVGLEVWGVGPT